MADFSLHATARVGVPHPIRPLPPRQPSLAAHAPERPAKPHVKPGTPPPGLPPETVRPGAETTPVASAPVPAPVPDPDPAPVPASVPAGSGPPVHDTRSSDDAARPVEQFPGRAHVRQGLQGLAHSVRDAIAGQLRGRETDRATLRELQSLQQEFRTQLRDTFLAAGDGGAVSRETLFAGMAAAVQDLTAGLREINGTAVDASPEAKTPAAAETPTAAETPAADEGLVFPVPASPDPVRQSDDSAGLMIDTAV